MNSDPEVRNLPESNSPSQSAAAAQSDAIGDDLLGTVYVGRYQLDALLGSGGMGVVYKAHQVFLDRVVAVKMLKAASIPEKARIRFHQEAKAASALDHPGIVSVVDFGVDELDRPYMVMEYVDGCSLGDLLEERVTLSLEETVPVILQVCDALSAAHKKGVVHRDIKPGNIMLVVTEDEPGVRVKILDFGIAKMLDLQDNTLQDLTRTGDAIGTPLYMSPEQIESKKVTARSDLYSLGCTIYACLTGAPPFVGETKVATMEMHCNEKPMSLRQASGGLEFSPAIEQIVMRLLEKDPNDRFENVVQLKQALILMGLKNGIDAGSDFLKDSPRQLEKASSISQSVVDSVFRNRTTQTRLRGARGSDKVQSINGGFEQAGNEEKSDQKNTIFWKSDLKRQSKKDDSRKPKVPADQKERLDREGRSFQVHSAGSWKKKFVGLFSLVSVLFLLVLGVLRGDQIKEICRGFLFKHDVDYISRPSVVTVTASTDVFRAPGSSGDSPTASGDSIIEKCIRDDVDTPILPISHSHGLTAAGLRRLFLLRRLKILVLEGVALNDSGVKTLSGLKLEKLCIDGNVAVTDWGLFFLNTMPTLTTLSVKTTGISNAGLKFLARDSNLKFLFLCFNRQLTDGAIRNLGPENSSLEGLGLINCNISDAGVEDLCKFKYLRYLGLSNNRRLTDRAIKILGRFPDKWKDLLLADNNLSSEGLHELLRFKNLEGLDLSGIKLDQMALNDLKSMKHLKKLNVAGCGLLPNELEALRKVSPSRMVDAELRRDYTIGSN